MRLVPIIGSANARLMTGSALAPSDDALSPRDGGSRRLTRIGCGLGVRELTYVIYEFKLTYMEKTQVYLPKEELEGLRRAAARSGRSVADLIREAIRKVVLRPQSTGPIALWDGEPKRTSIEHDSVHDEP